MSVVYFPREVFINLRRAGYLAERAAAIVVVRDKITGKLYSSE